MYNKEKKKLLAHLDSEIVEDLKEVGAYLAGELSHLYSLIGRLMI